MRFCVTDFNKIYSQFPNVVIINLCGNNLSLIRIIRVLFYCFSLLQQFANIKSRDAHIVIGSWKPMMMMAM